MNSHQPPGSDTLPKSKDSMRTFSFISSISQRRSLQWLVLVGCTVLFLLTVLWLPYKAQQIESTERQEQLIADTLWVEQSIRFQLGRNEDTIRGLANEIANNHLGGPLLLKRIQLILRTHPELAGMAWINRQGDILLSSGKAPSTIDIRGRLSTKLERLRNTLEPEYIQPDPPQDSRHSATMEYLFPVQQQGVYLGSLLVSYSMSGILEHMVPWWFAQKSEIRLTDRLENTLGQRTAGGIGRHVYTYAHDLHLPYADITLRTDSIRGAPRLMSNLLVVAIVLLSFGLFWSLTALWRDIRRRVQVERALRGQIAFRTAMEDSLVTGLRVYDLNGRITYVNPAFCRMVGIPAEDLIGRTPPMPYWAPELMPGYQERFSQRLSGTINTHGFETVFRRTDDERFPVLIYESALRDDTGRQTGWMGSIMDLSDRKRFEELSRRQQEKLEASARLVTMGELASTLAHELNQPLAAITSYTTGALNLLNDPEARLDENNTGRLRGALEKANTQAQRAGQIIRSVHTFTKRREPHLETVNLHTVITEVVQLAELQASQYFVRIHTDISSRLPTVMADPMMLGQVLLNLARNAIESMREMAPERRILIIQALCETAKPDHITISVIDRGCGISQDARERLFSPFFSTKPDGMGMGLKICRTIVESHGSSLTYRHHPEGGTIFWFSLAAAS